MEEQAGICASGHRVASKWKVVAVGAITATVVLLAVAALWFFMTNQVKGGLAAAIRHADIAIASEDYGIAKGILSNAIDAVPNRPDREALIAPAAERLRQIAAKAAEQDRQRRVEAELATRHQREREAERQNRIAAHRKATHDRFITYRDAALAAMKDKSYHAAIRQFDLALKEEDDAKVRSYRQQCLDKVTKHRIAVADFTVKGDVGIFGAGETVPELLLQEFGQERFQLVERSQLAAILAEHDLTIAKVVTNPALLAGKKLKGLRYLVLGSVVRLGSLAISARLVDVTTGDMIQTAKVTAEDAWGLQRTLGELARILQMTVAEKKAYLDAEQYPILLARARQLATDRQFDTAIRTFRRVLSIRSTQGVQNELDRVEADRASDVDKDNPPPPETKKSDWAWLGVELQPLNRELARLNDLSDLTRDGQIGALVSYIYPGSPAAKAGVTAGPDDPPWFLINIHVEGDPKPIDVTAERESRVRAGFPWTQWDRLPPQYWDGKFPTPWQPTETMLNRTLTDLGFGKKFVATFFTKGRQIRKPFAVVPSPTYYGLAPRFKSVPLGVTVREMTFEVRRYFQRRPGDPGVIVSAVEPDSKAGIGGIRPYEIITHVNDKPVPGIKNFEKLIAAQVELRLVVVRMTTGRLVRLQITDP